MQTVMAFHETINDWPNAVRQIRNDLAHGNKSYDSFELHRLAKTLDEMVQAHVLRSLGAPDEVLVRMLSAENSL